MYIYFVMFFQITYLKELKTNKIQFSISYCAMCQLSFAFLLSLLRCLILFEYIAH